MYKLFCFYFTIGPEGAFKKLKSESSSLGGVGPGGGGGSNSCVGNSHIHNPTAAACPTPARRRHRTTFTQVGFDSFPPFQNYNVITYLEFTTSPSFLSHGII